MAACATPRTRFTQTDVDDLAAYVAGRTFDARAVEYLLYALEDRAAGRGTPRHKCGAVAGRAFARLTAERERRLAARNRS